MTTQNLNLFSVLLDWNSNNRSEGDYKSTAWAINEDEAVRFVAEEMADSSDGVHRDDYKSDAEFNEARKEFVEGIVENAGIYAATKVSTSVIENLKELMTGASNQMSERANGDYQTILTILESHGITP